MLFSNGDNNGNRKTPSCTTYHQIQQGRRRDGLRGQSRFRLSLGGIPGPRRLTLHLGQLDGLILPLIAMKEQQL